METKLKRVPFDLDLAKKITEGKIKGAKITDKTGNPVRILAFDLKGEYTIAAAVMEDEEEKICAFTDKGKYLSYQAEYYKDLSLLAPVHYSDYANFTPQKWQPCLVRDYGSPWVIRVATGEYTESHKPYFFGSLPDLNRIERYDKFLPLSKLTIKLLGTSKSYDELLQEE